MTRQGRIVTTTGVGDQRSDAAERARPDGMGMSVQYSSARADVLSRARGAFADRGGACPRSANVSLEAPVTAVRD
jgi:hypothetical protein